MKLIHKNIGLLCFIATLFLVAYPYSVFANNECLKNGYTILTINGVLTNDKGAKKNKDALQYYFDSSYQHEPLTIDYLLNPIHSGGLGDFANVVVQKAFENETVEDYDLIEILKDASAKVKTQKLLLVAHSQGNFYANSFYDKVAGQTGGLPTQSIGVYSVATPASRVAGGGKWLTSDTDKVIATAVGNVPFKSIMTPNTHIVLQSDDDFMGHGFSEIYLKYRSAKIVKDTQSSLGELSVDSERREDILCIDPPKITLGHKVTGVALAVTDPVLNPVGVGARWTLGVGVDATVLTYTATVAVAKWTYNTTVATAIWTYDTTVAVGKFVGNAAVAVASTVYNAVAGALSSTAVAGSNSAAVILATQAQPKTQSAQTSAPVSTINKTAVISVVSQSTAKTQPVTPPTAPATVPTPVTNPSLTPVSAPKLVFVGPFGAGFGGGAPLQILGTQETTEPVEEVAGTGGGSGESVTLFAPTLSVPQCAYSLATSTDGCLLATTIIHFDWTPVSGVSFYTINKNGVYATTTEIGTDITALDFSDYTFEVSAVDAGGYASATSTKTVSVATIPIAINEIAWMGTVASTSAEWIEIKNNTAHTIDLSQWALASSDSKPFIVLTGTIAPREYRVLERWLDATIADVVAGQVYGNGGTQWALGNSGEQLNLSYASTTLDQTPVGAWVAGENSTTTRKTMERYSSRGLGIDASNWGTNLGYIKNGTDANGNAIAGTPGAQNSVSTLINKGQDITSDFTLTADEERYIVSGALNVSASSTLTIAPGVEVKFREKDLLHPAKLNVHGTLSVSGTPESPVSFSSFTPTPAGSIELFGNSTSTITSASFDTTYGGVNTYGGSLDVSNSSFSNVKYEAVGAYNSSIISIASTTISNIARGDAIGVYGGSFVSVASTTISNIARGEAVGAYNSSIISIASTTISNIARGDAVGVYGGSFVSVASTTIDGVLHGSGIAIYDSDLLVSSSTIRNVGDSGLLLSNASSAISNLAIENAGWAGIDIYEGVATITNTDVSGATGWAGISVFEPAEPVIITGGEVTGNKRGISMDDGSAVITDVFVHDNGTSDDDNIVAW